jgi:glyoxylase I family protein
MRAAGVHHVSINVTDVPAALSFYTDVLGLTQRTDRPDFAVGGAWLDAGGQQVHLIDAPMPDQKGQHFAFRVDDIDAAVADIRALGVTVSDPKAAGPNRQCFLHDPCGNMVELNQPAAT